MIDGRPTALGTAERAVTCAVAQRCSSRPKRAVNGAGVPFWFLIASTSPGGDGALLDNDTVRATKGRGVLEGAFALLDVLGSMNNDVGLSELAKSSGLPKTTVHRLLDQLGELGAVERSSGGYRIGSRVFRLGQGWQTELRDHALRTLRALSMRIRETVGLAMPREGRILIVASSVVRPQEAPRMRPGLTVPLETASGKVLAAFDPLLGIPSGLSAEAWAAAAYRIRAAGVAYDDEEFVPGLRCAAVPVRTGAGRVAGSLAVVVMADRSPSAFVPDLTAAAQAMGAGLPGSGTPSTSDDGGDRASTQ